MGMDEQKNKRSHGIQEKGMCISQKISLNQVRPYHHRSVINSVNVSFFRTSFTYLWINLIFFNLECVDFWVFKIFLGAATKMGYMYVIFSITQVRERERERERENTTG